MQKYECDAPPLTAPDTVTRKFNLEVDGNVTTTDHPKDVSVVPFTVDDGKHFKVWFVDVDDAGNESAPGASYEADAVDDIPPPAPNAPNVRHVGEA